MTAFSSSPARVDIRVDRLGAQRVGLAVELLRQEIEAPPGRLARVEQLARAGDVRAQALQLLLDVGARRQHRRLLVEPVSSRRGSVSSSRASCSLRRLRMASGVRAGEAAIAATSVSMAASWSRTIARQPAAFRLARAHHGLERLVEARQHRGVRAGSLALALLRLADLEHALDAEQRLGARRRGVGVFSRGVERRQHLGQRRLVEPD